PPVMRVVFTVLAKAQLNDIHDYIASDNASAAARVVRRIEDVANLLIDNPYMGRKISGRRSRRLAVKDYPYLIYYDVTDDCVRILQIRHAARFRQVFQEPSRAFIR
ncbi:MAG TPA: type II toxin-antitoxin system RelE/ParE family toxin, partial [Tepidisphaeraceae bacterium]|nr:type II toxin-antitoxin system RelE/ParE family toxin [Tepidisphaeraceae bacterium]